jgi:membrane-associated phospholipid phosphatase
MHRKLDDVHTLSPARVIKRWAIAAVVTALTTSLCIAYVDRPIAYYFWPMRTSMAAHAIRLLLMLLIAFPVIATGVLVVAAIARAGGGTPRIGQFALLCSWATLTALAVEQLLKHAFGRLPVEALIANHYPYEFLWLRGGDNTSFPSGTATVCFAIATVVWLVRPRMRWPVLALAAMASMAVIVITVHWVADVVAGVFVGVFVGWATVQLLGQPRPLDVEDEISLAHQDANVAR